MRVSLLKALLFVAAAIAALIASGPLVGFAGAVFGLATVPMWAYAGAFSVLLLACTAVALALDRTGFSSLGLAPTRDRIRECVFGFVLGALLFAVLALVRGATVGATWTFQGPSAVGDAAFGIVTAFLMLFPEELLFRGYAFRRLVAAAGAWPAIAISAVLFGIYHVAGSGMWGIGAFFQLAMPALGGVVFGWIAVRTKGLALPIGLHLGGNWVQASVLSFRPNSDVLPAALWSARLTDLELRSLYTPDLGTHVPFIATMLLAAMAVRVIVNRQPSIAHE